MRKQKGLQHKKIKKPEIFDFLAFFHTMFALLEIPFLGIIFFTLICPENKYIKRINIINTHRKTNIILIINYNHHGKRSKRIYKITDQLRTS